MSQKGVLLFGKMKGLGDELCLGLGRLSPTMWITSKPESSNKLGYFISRNQVHQKKIKINILSHSGAFSINLGPYFLYS